MSDPVGREVVFEFSSASVKNLVECPRCGRWGTRSVCVSEGASIGLTFNCVECGGHATSFIYPNGQVGAAAPDKEEGG